MQLILKRKKKNKVSFSLSPTQAITVTKTVVILRSIISLWWSKEEDLPRMAFGTSWISVLGWMVVPKSLTKVIWNNYLCMVRRNKCRFLLLSSILWLKVQTNSRNMSKCCPNRDLISRCLTKETFTAWRRRVKGEIQLKVEVEMMLSPTLFPEYFRCLHMPCHKTHKSPELSFLVYLI